VVAEHHAVDRQFLFVLLGSSALLAFVGLGLACAALQQRLLTARHALGIGLSALWLGLWWRTSDFDYVGSLYVSWLAAYALVAARDLGFVPRTAGLRRAAVAALALFLVLPLWPLGLARPPWPVAEERRQLRFVHEGWDQALAWLRENTPPEPFDPLDPAPGWDEHDLAYPPGSYGVVTGWEHGNLVALHGRRFVRHSRFPTRRMARWWLATDEETALGHLVADDPAAEPLRYVVVDARQSAESFLADHFLLVADPRPLVAGASSPRTGAHDLAAPRTYGPAFDRSLAASVRRQHSSEGSWLQGKRGRLCGGRPPFPL
jgi:hypothetical protein